jgi:hypothetical protein
VILIFTDSNSVYFLQKSQVITTFDKNSQLKKIGACQFLILYYGSFQQEMLRSILYTWLVLHLVAPFSAQQVQQYHDET